MPAVPPKSIILVSGASGFIAIWIVKRLLESPQEFIVRGTVRSQDKATHLKKLFADYGDRLELPIVKDIGAPNAFDEVVKGCTGVIHTASPFSLHAKSPKELIDPAINGTTGVLKSVIKNAPTVKRVVVTSSFAAMSEFDPTIPASITEASWNVESAPQCDKEGDNSDPGQMYYASKTLAERALWKYATKSNGFDIVAVNPVFVFGPILHEVPDSSKLNASASMLYSLLKGEVTGNALAEFRGNYIDVRDVAYGHVEAISKEEIGGTRLMMAAGPWSYQDLADAVHRTSVASLLPKLPKAGGPNDTPDRVQRFDNTKTKKLLGSKGVPFEFLSLEKTAEDTVKSFQSYGFM